MEGKTITCIAIDDEPLALRLIQQYADQIEDLSLEKHFDDPLLAKEFLRHHTVDLIFLDINMPDITGLQLIREMPNRKPLVVFTTAYRDYAYDSYELEAIDYLLKPIAFDRFEKAVEKARAMLHIASPAEPFLLVRSEYKLLKIPLETIECIESLVDYVKIHVQDTPHPVLSLISMKEMQAGLPANRFSRIHRGAIINHDFITSVRGRKVLLRSGKELNVSDSYQEFLQKWKNVL